VIRPYHHRVRRVEVLAVVAAGGVLGALARYGLGVAFPLQARHFPWTTFAVNVSGCLLIGVLVVLVTEVWAAHRLLRPFLGTGLLGGYTTFSTYEVDVRDLVVDRAPATAAAYLAGTLAAALLATYLGVLVTRALTRRRLA
jgi:CrcB protein